MLVNEQKRRKNFFSMVRLNEKYIKQKFIYGLEFRGVIDSFQLAE